MEAQQASPSPDLDIDSLADKTLLIPDRKAG